MRRMIGPALAVGLVCLTAGLAQGHFSILLPEAASVAPDRAVEILYLWGHPFEHQLFDAPPPERVLVLTPDGKETDITKSAEKITTPVPGGKGVTAYRLRYTPERRGDYIFVLTTPPIWMEAEEEFWQDTVRVVVHLATQKGWDAATGKGFELVPLTRPYGLEPGMVFQAQAQLDGKPWAAAVVEVERYNPAPPKELPPDEQITRRVKTDPNGVATCTLTEAGWWCITAQREAGQRERDGKMYPLRQRASFWVFVDSRGGRPTAK
jgi:cobalt/nickel transport protein